MNIDSGTTCLYQKYCEKPSDHFLSPKNCVERLILTSTPRNHSKGSKVFPANHSTAIGNDTDCNGSDYQLKSFSSMHSRIFFSLMQKFTMKRNKHDDCITRIHFSPYQNLVLTQFFLSKFLQLLLAITPFAFFTVDE